MSALTQTVLKKLLMKRFEKNQTEGLDLYHFQRSERRAAGATCLVHHYGHGGFLSDLIEDLDTVEEIREAKSWAYDTEMAEDADDYEDNLMATITFLDIPWEEILSAQEEVQAAVERTEPSWLPGFEGLIGDESYREARAEKRAAFAKVRL
jgi:hypothetical protein